MKKIFLCFIAVCFALTSVAQEQVATYHSSYFDKEYDILASNNDNKLNLYIEVGGKYDSDYVLFNIEGESKINSFISALESTKEKFVEWSSVAKQNNVKSFDKDFDVTFPSITIAWKGSEWRFDFYNKLKPRFVVTSSGECVAVMTGKATASNNEYIDQEYYFALSSVSDFDGLISEIKIDALKAHFNKKSDVGALFN